MLELLRLALIAPGAFLDVHSQGDELAFLRPPQASSLRSDFRLFLLQSELDLEKGLEMRKWVLSGILASEETYLSHLEALLLVRRVQGPSGAGQGHRELSSHGPGPRSAARAWGHPPSFESLRSLGRCQGVRKIKF